MINNFGINKLKDFGEIESKVVNQFKEIDLIKLSFDSKLLIKISIILG